MSVDVQAIREELEREGYELSDLEFSRVLQISYRKMDIAAQPEEYLSLLLPDMIREAVFRNAINTVGIGILILKEEEALENGTNDYRGVGGIHSVKAYGGTDEAQKGVAARIQS